MSHEDPKNTDKAEGKASETSRRRFLKGSAAAAVGAIAAGVVPKAAEAGGVGVVDTNNNLLPPVSYHPNDKLAEAIARAWTDKDYETSLLYDGIRGTDYSKARDALAKVEVFIDKPVVLTPQQYAAGYKKRDNSEVVFVLPERPFATKKEWNDVLATAKVKMSETIDGM